MIQHTMQEIADFFGLPTALSNFGVVVVFYNKPIIKNNDWIAENGYGYMTTFPVSAVSDAVTHDWTVLVEPHTGYTCPHCGKPLNVTVKKGTCEPICDKCGGKISEDLFDEIIERGR